MDAATASISKVAKDTGEVVSNAAKNTGEVVSNAAKTTHDTVSKGASQLWRNLMVLDDKEELTAPFASGGEVVSNAAKATSKGASQIWRNLMVLNKDEELTAPFAITPRSSSQKNTLQQSRREEKCLEEESADRGEAIENGTKC
mmetsp:Transcript_28904/g.33061  ORF Transcript_28904/g.33061 Transcript_28904/m.33061 type:complete len:144 (-) Transcript_28904:37-468(-)